MLVEKCYECHSAEAKVLKGGLRLDTAERMRAGGESGPVIVPNKPDESLLISALRYESNEMPPSGKLPDAVINDFVKWISLGAPDPRTEAAGRRDRTKQARSRATIGPTSVRSARRRRKSRTKRPPAPTSTASFWPASKRPASRHRRKPPPRALLRRLYYDLIGLPPTAEELDEFAADPSDARYEATVDRLLASPRFGERWARHWLDVARYADTKGYVFQEDRNYKQAYTYRDWVIASFNADRPFDKFIVAQIAADQIGDPSCAPAIGFLTLGRRFLNVQPDIINDRIDVVTRGLMGLTVACARCHDHKFDPISAADYYALYGVFASSQEKPRDDAPPELVDADKPYDPYVFLRGDPGNRGPKVERRFLTCLVAREQAGAVPTRQRPPRNGRGDRQPRQPAHRPRVGQPRVGPSVWPWPRRYAERFRRPRHAADASGTARFAGLRVDGRWLVDQAAHSPHRAFGHVPASERHARPSVPPSIRKIDCCGGPIAAGSIWNRCATRCSSSAGRLDEKMGGPSVSLTDAPFSTRRSVYGFIERQNLPAFFRTFDFANPNTHTPERPQTTAPQQALFLMNSPFAIEQASFLAARSENPGVAGVEPQASPQTVPTSPGPNAD